MASVNKVILVGHLGHDPSMSNMPNNGTLVAEFSLATTESWKDKKTGEYKNITEWHKVKVLNERIAGFVKEYLRKGTRIYLEGKIQTSTWTGKDGTEKRKTEIVLTQYKGEIVLLTSKKEDEVAENHGENSNQHVAHASSNNKIDYSSVTLDDDVPF